MFRRVFAPILILTAGAFSGAALAADGGPGVDNSGALIEFSVTAASQVKNNTCTVLLRVSERRASSQASLEAMTKKMEALRVKARELLPKAEFQTIGFRTWPVYEEKKDGSEQKIIAWESGSSLEVQTKDIGAVPRLIDESAPFATVDSVSFSVDEATRFLLQDSLQEKLVGQARARLAAIASSFGLSPERAKIMEIRFSGTSGVRYSNDSMVLMAAKSARAPVKLVEGSADISAQAHIKAKIYP